MPSSYSTNLKIELQATGENSGTWGTITNTNLGTALEQAIVGYGNPSYASDANLTLTYTDTNAAQAARALVLNVTSAVSLTGTRELVVPTIQKQYIVQNNTTGSQSITVKTSGGTGITVPNGRKAHLYVDGTNVIYMDDFVDINGGAIDGTPIGANSASTGSFTTLATSSTVTVNGGTANQVQYLNASKQQVGSANLTFDGTTLTAANFADSSLTSGRVTYAGASGNLTDSASLTFDGTTLATTTVDATNVEVTNIKAKDGTAAASIADSTGVISLTSNPTLSGGTANGVLYLNGSKVATSGSALTFDGTTLANINSDGTGFSTQSAASNFSIMRFGTDSVNGYAFFQSGKSGTGTTLPFAWRQDSSELMRLTSTGLGIGTSSPAVKLDVAGASTTQVRVQMSGQADVRLLSDTGTGITGTYSNHPFTIKTNSADVMSLTAAGNVGIGTSSPAQKLHISTASGAIFQQISSGTNQVYIGWDSSGGQGTVQTNAGLGFMTGATYTQKMWLDTSGNLGLGVTPSAWASGQVAIEMGGTVGNLAFNSSGATREGYLYWNSFYNGTNTVYKASGYAAAYGHNNGQHAWYTAPSGTAGNTITFTQAMTLDASGNLQLGTTTNKTTTIGGSGSGMTVGGSGAPGYTAWNTGNADWVYTTAVGNDGTVYLYNKGNTPMLFYTNNTERARIDSSGNLGIGTSSPASRLDVRNTGGTYDKGISVQTASGGNIGTIWTSLTDLNIGIAGAHKFTNFDGSATRMTLDSSGNLGLGVTPDGNNLAKVFQLEQGFTMFGFSNTSYLSANAYYNSGWKYKSTAAAAYYEMSGANGHKWNIAASGTINTAISFTTAMTLDASGNLGVGTTSPAQKLHIYTGSSPASVKVQRTTVPTYLTDSAVGATTANSFWSINVPNTSNGSSSWGTFENTGYAGAAVSLESNAGSDSKILFYTATAANTNPSERMRISGNGEVYIAGTTDQGAYNLQVAGTGVWGAGAYVNGSDERLKNNIQSLDSGLDVVKAMRAVAFQYKPEYSKDQSVQPGFIAQELQQAMAGKPYLDGVVQAGPEYLNVAYQNIIPILVKAMQEQQAMIEELKAEVAALEAK